ncbi:hypothetical protein B0A48_12101 [Cryoendolithus antarcticus]|uniref:Uncharacterized protein n=1 Tax=Cryoendolithus antarcticus TaxID=1507870 RepID=A0A1V8STT0_9PEZI|nr:hypothetical protein B0A48_12101 [Cryoendolithus antarcticus]
MPGLRAFPMPALGVGTDICAVSRISHIINRRLPQTSRPRAPANKSAKTEAEPIPVRTDAIKRMHHFTRRILTPVERYAFSKTYGPSISALEQHGREPVEDVVKHPNSHIANISRHLAGRWAAKEAVIKACHWRDLSVQEVQIMVSKESRKIYGVILDERQETEKLSLGTLSHVIDEAVETAKHEGDGADAYGTYPEVVSGKPKAGPGIVVRVSISHDGQYATAVCVAVADEGVAGDVGGEAAAREPI